MTAVSVFVHHQRDLIQPRFDSGYSEPTVRCKPGSRLPPLLEFEVRGHPTKARNNLDCGQLYKDIFPRWQGIADPNSLRSRIRLDLKIPDVKSPFFLKNQCYEFLLLDEKNKPSKSRSFFY